MKTLQFRYVIVALCFLLGVVNYLDRTAIAFYSAPIMESFGLDHTGFGLVASAFAIGYFLFTFLGGWAADVVGSRRLFGVTAVIWGACTALIGVLSSFWSLFTLRALLGAAEGPVYPGLVKAFNDWLPRNERGRAIACAVPGSVPVAIILGGPLASLLYTLTGHWQTMFFLLGGLSIVMAVAWVMIFRDNPAHSRHMKATELEKLREDRNVPGGPNASADDSPPTDYRAVRLTHLLRDRTLISTYVSFLALGYLFWFVLTWLPQFLQETYHLNLTTSALFTVFPWAAYGAGALAAGHVADRMARATGSAQVKKHLIWIGLLGAAVCIVPIFVFSSTAVAIIFISLAMGLCGMVVSPLWALNSDVVPQRSGLSAGIMDASFALAGLLAPVISGFLVQQSGSYSGPLILTSVITGVAGLFVVVVANPDASARHFAQLSREGARPALSLKDQ